MLRVQGSREPSEGDVEIERDVEIEPRGWCLESLGLEDGFSCCRHGEEGDLRWPVGGIGSWVGCPSSQHLRYSGSLTADCIPKP